MIQPFACALMSALMLAPSSFAAPKDRPATPRAVAATSVKEADFKTYRAVQYARALSEARRMFARGDKAKIAAAAALPEAALRDGGWTQDRFNEVDEAIGGVHSALRSAKDGEMSAADLASTLAEYDAATVATVKAHLAELERTNDSTRAEQQVRDEINRELAGETPTSAQLLGTWVFDADASVEAMLGGVSGKERTKMAAELSDRIGRPSYTFGPGDQVEIRSKGSEGKEKIEKAIFRIDGRTLFFKSEGRKREESLQAGIRNGKLILGSGFGRVAFSRK